MFQPAPASMVNLSRPQFTETVSAEIPKLGSVTNAVTESLLELLNKQPAVKSANCPPAVCQLY